MGGLGVDLEGKRFRVCEGIQFIKSKEMMRTHRK